MKSLGCVAAILLLLGVAGCRAGRSAELYDASLQEYHDPGLQPLKDEVRSLPFREIVWDYKFRDDISRITLGAEDLYLETPDHKVIAVDRFGGTKRWEFGIDTRTPLDWPPVEAYGVAEEIRALEAEIRACNRRIEDIVKEKGPGEESQKAQKKRDQVSEQLRHAQNGDNVYLISRGVLYCIVRKTGNLLWTRRLTSEFAPSGQPFAVRGYVFVPGGDLSRVWALDVERKGQSITFYRTGLGAHDKAVTNRPLYEDPALYFVSHDGQVYSYNVNGDLNWTYPTEDELRADPVLYEYREMVDDGKGGKREAVTKMLFVGGFDNAFYAIDAAGGGLLWKFETAGPIKSAAVAKDRTVYVKTEGGALFAFDVNPQHRDPKTGKAEGPKRNGNMRWRLPLGERFLLKGRDYVYVMGPNSEIYRLNEYTGEVIGRYPLELLTHVVTNPIDPILYVAHPSGHVFALRETSE
ncbi:MAG: PQQ-binding-like beta-propeller repeat protein [Planctomycetes bacterium]|nr:PQQ-binding-like beta-propeller repeat protein [Planctomycetota bacterium]